MAMDNCRPFYVCLFLATLTAATTPSMAHYDKSANSINRYRSYLDDMLLADPPVSRDDHHSFSHVARPLKKLHSENSVKRLPKKRSKPVDEVKLSTASIRKLMSEVIAERDAQLISVFVDANKTEVHLKSIVEMIEESNQISQNIASVMIKLDEGLRRLDTKVVVMGEKLSQVEARQSQLDRRIEREISTLANRMEDVVRKSNKVESATTSERILLDIRELLSDLSVSMDKMTNEKGPEYFEVDNQLSPLPATVLPKPSQEASLETRLVSVMQATHGDIIKVVREVESNLDHQLAMLSGDSAYIHCGVGKLIEQAVLMNMKEDNNDIHQVAAFVNCTKLANGNAASFCP